jgi:hypothetical protein
MSFRRRMEDDIDRDIRDHIEMETRENIERGMAPSEARAAALRKFGNPLRIAEDTRAVWRSECVERLLQDTRYALRGLRRNPVFAVVVILTLALGIGLNTAVFSVVNAVLIEPLHYPHPERLLWLTNYNKAFKVEIAGGPDFVDWRAQAQSFDKMFCYEFDNETITFDKATDRPVVAEVSGDFWPVAGVKPDASSPMRTETSSSSLSPCFSGGSARIPLSSAKLSWWTAIPLRWLESCRQASAFSFPLHRGPTLIPPRSRPTSPAIKRPPLRCGAAAIQS